jgi:hypothetical protein
MWYVKRELGDIGKNYLVIDPACGSGNLVTNWRSPLELRHKVVSEIEPELLFAVERRMKGDEWHNGKFTVVPKVSEAKGLNFLDKSSEDYLGILKDYLADKGLKADKPIAFLCNPPYRSDDDQGAESVKYQVHDSITEITGKDASSERYCCFLAQMKLICDQAESSGLPGQSLLLLFTQGSWLSDRPVYQKIRHEIFGNFQDIGGILFHSKEFFDVNGSFPIAFTIWRHVGLDANLDRNRPVELYDLTSIKKEDLRALPWEDPHKLSEHCEQILAKAAKVPMGVKIESVSGNWVGFGRRNLYRSITKVEKVSGSPNMGLPTGDLRFRKKTIYGNSDGNAIGFLLDLTPCRTKVEEELAGLPWFHLDSRFMRVRSVRCFSGLPDSRGYCARDEQSASRMFSWFALARTFASEGYPMWVNQLEMWTIELSEELRRISYAIGFAENECVETVFPANNPAKGNIELYSSNPMSPNSSRSFWTTVMKPVFETGSSVAHDLVTAVENLFKVWKKHLGNSHEISVSYERPYFVGKGKLTANSGIIQIRDYAKENNVNVLSVEIEKVQKLLSKVKKDFHKKLLSKNDLNYFGQPSNAIAAKPVLVKPQESRSHFDKVLYLRLIVSAKIVESLKGDVNFGRVKFAKVLYLTEKSANLDLKTDYYREAAGPLDQRALYNQKVGIESLAMEKGIFTTKVKSIELEGKKRNIVNYVPGKNLPEYTSTFSNEIGDPGKEKEVLRVIKLIKPMTTDQIEIVATLYAAWNDLLIKGKGKTVIDLKIINEFLNHWHENKKRFKKDQLIKALSWMRKHKLVPSGKGKLTLEKPNHDIDF